MSEPEQSPLARLVLFIVCLAIAGSALAGAHYYAIDLPDQQNAARNPPENTNTMALKCKNCLLGCTYDPNPVACLNNCDLYC